MHPPTRLGAGLVAIVVALVAGACSGNRTLAWHSCNMSPTMQPGDTLTLISVTGPIRRGDIVEFHLPPAATQQTLAVSRVVGLPGETVAFHDGHVYVNGQLLEAPYLRDDMPHLVAGAGTPGFPPGASSLAVPADSYFLLGDNGHDSQDSRYYGSVRRSAVVAKVSSIDTGARVSGTCP